VTGGLNKCRGVATKLAQSRLQKIISKMESEIVRTPRAVYRVLFGGSIATAGESNRVLGINQPRSDESPEFC
jgi:hypothetical protein